MSNLRQKIIDLSIKNIERGDLNGLSMRKIAQQLEVTHQAPYHHFKSKDALIKELKKLALEKVLVEYQSVLVKVDDPFEAFRQLGVRFIKLFINEPGLYKALNSSAEVDKQMIEVVKKTDELMRSVIRRACNASSKEISEDELRLTCWSCANGFVSLYLNQLVKYKKTEVDQIIDNNTKFLTDLIK